MTAPETLGRKPKKAKPVQKYYVFEHEKRIWLAEHPHCTSLEYQQAIKRIADSIGV